MSWLSKWGKKAEKFVSNVVPHQHSAERRAAMSAAQEQIDMYRGLKDEAAKRRQEYEDDKKKEQQKLAEKQARGLRRRRRAPGFMQDSGGDVNEKLG